VWQQQNRQNRNYFASAIAKLVTANIPDADRFTQAENDWNNRETFPYEIDSINIYRFSKSQGNEWSAPSAGLFRENFTDELQAVISEKDLKLCGYAKNCDQQWLLIVAENSSPSTFFDPSEQTVNHVYKSSFEKVFLFKLFSEKLSELKLTGKKINSPNSAAA
jgi:hypothetical protein